MKVLTAPLGRVLAGMSIEDSEVALALDASDRNKMMPVTMPRPWPQTRNHR